jgi:hypothetical protein
MRFRWLLFCAKSGGALEPPAPVALASGQVIERDADPRDRQPTFWSAFAWLVWAVLFAFFAFIFALSDFVAQESGGGFFADFAGVGVPDVLCPPSVQGKVPVP